MIPTAVVVVAAVAAVVVDVVVPSPSLCCSSLGMARHPRPSGFQLGSLPLHLPHCPQATDFESSKNKSLLTIGCSRMQLI